jgi:lactoylglutathione lyase
MAVLQMRLVVEAEDYDEAVAFYRDVLGAPEELSVDSGDGARVTILDVGRATLELSTPQQVDLIDRVEVGRRVSPRLRVAFEVSDAEAATRQLTDAGAELVAPPTVTPWNSLNSRLQGPAELQLTLFQELTTDEALPGPSVLVLGLDPYRVTGPWDPKPVADGIEAGRAQFAAQGLSVDYCLVGLDGSDDVETVVTDALRARTWDCVVVGGGVRDDLLLFEQVANLVHRHAATARIAFSSDPEGAYDAAARALSRPGPHRSGPSQDS